MFNLFTRISIFFPGNFTNNCVPEGFYYDNEQKMLVKCTEKNSNYYINGTNSKKICFKNTLSCPDELPY